MVIERKKNGQCAWTLAACALMLLGGNACADDEWLTMSGDGELPLNTAQNLIQVNPQSIEGSAELRTMGVRVSRSAQRTNWDGLPYRSYVATVEFDCVKKTARYVLINYYLTPVWSGPVHKAVSYPLQNPRYMAFREVTPNPLDRIVRAACMSGSVLSN